MSTAGPVTVAVDIGSSRVKAAVAGTDGVVRVVQFGEHPWMDTGTAVDQDGTIATGQAATRRMRDRPEGWVGDPLGRLMQGPFDVAGVCIDPADLVAAVLRTVLTTASSQYGKADAVRVVVPVAWGPRRRTALRGVLHRAGVGDAELLDAPTALGWHLLAGGVEPPAGSHVLVCDFGAGFTASVLARTTDGFQELATISDPAAGGAAVDVVIAALLVTLPSTAAPTPSRLPVLATETDQDATRTITEYAVRARQAKEALSTTSSVVIYAPAGAVVLDVTHLGQATGPVLTRAVAVARQAVDAADLQTSQLSLVLCVGGGARMPVIADALTEAFGTRPVMVARADTAYAVGAAQAPAAAPAAAPAGSNTSARSVRDGVGSVLATAVSVGLYAQFIAGTQRYGPRQSITPGTLLAHWGGLASAAVLAVVAAAAGAAWLHTATDPTVEPRTSERRYGALLMMAALIGLAVPAGYAIVAASYFDVPVEPLLRWSMLPALPLAAVSAVAGIVVLRHPHPPAAPTAGGAGRATADGQRAMSWRDRLRLPAASVALIAVGVLLIGYDVSGSPTALNLLWWLAGQWMPGPTMHIISPLGRVGAACIGAAIAVLLVRRLQHRLLLGALFGGVAALGLAWRTTGVLAVAWASVIAVWWLWRALSPFAWAALRAEPAANPPFAPPGPPPPADGREPGTVRDSWQTHR